MPEKMNAYVMTGPRQSEVTQINRFTPEPGEAVVKTAAAAICTTERRIFSGALKIPYPIIGGHEVAGTVAEINDGNSDLKPGDRVVLDAIGRCGACHYCVRGYSNLCTRAYSSGREGYRVVGGGFAEYVTISAKRLFRIGDQISYPEAALTEPVSCCIRSIKRSGLTFGDHAVVIGVGTMGALHILLAHQLGVHVTAVDLDQTRLDLAGRLGAHSIINPSQENASEVIRQATKGRGADVVFIAASNRAAGELALGVVGKTGRVVFFAATHPPEEILVPWNLLHHQEVSLVGTVGKTEDEFRQAAEILSNGSLNVEPIISRTISINELTQELGDNPAGEVYRVVVVHPN